ncbi:MAG: lipid-A-disaccharide synthase [Bacteroidales bacterium]|jgi:lipid-A-disaccharide synthase|nr:lipid-A-disaccharide synthase [Bacteroidales bacterium]
MKYYIIAGEASGDLHGSRVIREIKKNDPQAQFRVWGGDKMAHEAGVEPVKHYKDYDHMGLVEVVKHLRKILRNIEFCKKDIAAYTPDAVIFVDFPGFNLKVAPAVKRLGIPTFFYISPTVWAWKESRVKLIQSCIDYMFVELPFIKEFYETRHNFPVDFVGHPLLDSVNEFVSKYASIEEFQQANNLPKKPIIAVMPGSREYEIRENLKTMQTVSEEFLNYEFVIAGMSRFSEDFYRRFITASNVSIVFDQTYELLSKATASITVSGTATLEAALFDVPEIVVYQTNPITFYVGKMIVKLNYLGLPNIIMNEQIVPELLQRDMNENNLRTALETVLCEEERAKIHHSYKQLRTRLGEEGAALRVARKIQEYLQ